MLICIEKFAKRTSVNFTQQCGNNRQRCQQNKFYYAVWQLLLYYYREFPSKILSVQLISQILNIPRKNHVMGDFSTNYSVQVIEVLS